MTRWGSWAMGPIPCARLLSVPASWSGLSLHFVVGVCHVAVGGWYHGGYTLSCAAALHTVLWAWFKTRANLSVFSLPIQKFQKYEGVGKPTLCPGDHKLIQLQHSRAKKCTRISIFVKFWFKVDFFRKKGQKFGPQTFWQNFKWRFDHFNKLLAIKEFFHDVYKGQF